VSRNQIRPEVSADPGAPTVFDSFGNVDAWTLGKVKFAADYDGEEAVRSVSLGLPEEK